MDSQPQHQHQHQQQQPPPPRLSQLQRLGSDPHLLATRTGTLIVPRPDLLDCGVLELAPATRLDLQALFKLIAYAKSKGDRGFPMLSFSVWARWAGHTAQIAADTAWLYFETFELLHKVDDTVRQRRAEEYSAALNPAILDRIRSETTVPLQEFVVFLYMQQFGGVSLRAKASDPEGEWLAPHAPPEHETYAELRLAKETHRVNFLQRHMGDLLRVLAEPEIQNADEADLNIPLSALPALSLVLLCLPSPTEAPVPLQAFALRQSETAANGFSKITQTFAYPKLLAWLHSRLVHHPRLLIPAQTDSSSGSSSSIPPTPIEPKPLIVRDPQNTTVARLHRKTAQMSAEGIEHSDVDVVRCTASYIYILAPVHNVVLEDCRNCIVVLGAVAGTLLFTRCKKVTLIATCRRLVCSRLDDCTVHVCTPTRPVLLHSTSNLVLAPYNTHYPLLEDHMRAAELLHTVNAWDNPLATVPKGPQAASFSLMPPDEFFAFTVPFQMPGSTTSNPCVLPEAYRASLLKHDNALQAIQQRLQSLGLDRAAEAEFSAALHSRFLEWLSEHGHSRQLSDLQDLAQQYEQRNAGQSAGSPNPAK